MPGFTKQKKLFLNVNSVYDQVALWPFSYGDTHLYYSVNNLQSDDYLLQDGSSDLMVIQIEMDFAYLHIERKVYTISDLIGQIGGIIEIFMI